jgi:hypothetical protein
VRRTSDQANPDALTHRLWNDRWRTPQMGPPRFPVQPDGMGASLPTRLPRGAARSPSRFMSHIYHKMGTIPRGRAQHFAPVPWGKVRTYGRSRETATQPTPIGANRCQWLLGRPAAS